jgi:predicted DCC family thiol-disulfide oxidoreductase YuxK
VQFIIRRDQRGVFRFAALQSSAAKTLIASRPEASSLPDSIVLVEDGRVHVQSKAILRIARRLSGLWPLAYAFIIVPRPVRDWLYVWVARNRYRWFGQRDSCMMPTDELRARFIG